MNAEYRDFLEQDMGEDALRQREMKIPTSGISRRRVTMVRRRNESPESPRSPCTRMGHGEDTYHSYNSDEVLRDGVTGRKRMLIDTKSRDDVLQKPKANIRRNFIVCGRATRFRRGSARTGSPFSGAHMWNTERTEQVYNSKEDIRVTITNKYRCPVDDDRKGNVFQGGETNLRTNGTVSDRAIKLYTGGQPDQWPTYPGTDMEYGERTRPDCNVHETLLVTTTNEYGASIDDGTSEHHNNDRVLLVTITNNHNGLTDECNGDDENQQRNTNIGTSEFASVGETKLCGRAVTYKYPKYPGTPVVHSEGTPQSYNSQDILVTVMNEHSDLIEADGPIDNFTLNSITNSTATMPLMREETDESDTPKSETSGKRCYKGWTSTANSQSLRRRDCQGTRLYSETIRKEGSCTKSQGVRNPCFQSDVASGRGIPKWQPSSIRDWMGVPHGYGGHAQVEQQNIAQVLPHRHGQRVDPYLSPFVCYCHGAYRVQRCECEQTALTCMKCYAFAGTLLGHANVSEHNSTHCLGNSRQGGWTL
ncbi:uncharacterized protein LOC135368395 isoform X2 [Ornithodoros turicata]|uniref:uncharacterized protein LOC135368395 isoform X2 n=1 Tax=Ornithodoros turicata TaxID=34597 RepID=UPI00313A0776